jgi:drug/metabolite transporter (DMT)-like permease
MGDSRAVTRSISKKPRIHIAMSFFTLIWGSNFIFAEVAVKELSPLVFSAGRFLLGGVVLVLLFAIGERIRQNSIRTIFSWRIGRSSHLPVVLIAALLGAVLAPWMGIEGLARTSGARAALWLAFAPLISGFLGRKFRTENLGPAGFAGVGLSLIGGIVLAVDGLQGGGQYWFGDLLLFGSVLFSVAELHLLKPVLQKRSPAEVMMARTLFGGLLYSLIALPRASVISWSSLPAIVWVALAFGGILAIGIGHWVQAHAVRAIGPTRVVLYHNAVPIVAIVASAVLLLSKPSVLESFAIILIVSGLGLVQSNVGSSSPEKSISELKVRLEDAIPVTSELNSNHP